LYRPKQGFSVPLAAWFRGALGQHFRARLEARDGFASAGYIDRDVVERLMAQHQSGAYDHSRTLWLVWMFEAFMERESQRAPAPRRETVAAR
jgi:asparagine synthase (glutamine-hydrolysing)